MYARATGALATALLLSTAASAAAAQSRGTAMRVARDDLLATDSLWSGRSADSGLAALAPAVAADAWYLAAGEPLAQGRTRIVERLRGDAARAAHGVGWRAIGAGISRDGNFGYTYGYTAAHGDSGVTHGKYIAVWQRRTATWELAALVLSGGGPATLPDAPVAFAPSGLADRASGARFAAMAADSAFARDAASRGVADAFATHAAPDGAILSGPPSIVVGPAAIRVVYAGLPSTARLVWAPVDGRAAASGDLAFTVGEAIFSLIDPATGRTRRAYSKYLTIWRRQFDGRWAFVVDGGNARPAA